MGKSALPHCLGTVVQIVGSGFALLWILLVINVFFLGANMTKLEKQQRESHHLENVFHPKSKASGKLEVIEEYHRDSSARDTAHMDHMKGGHTHQVPDTAEWSIKSAPLVSKVNPRAMPPRPLMSQPAAPKMPPLPAGYVAPKEKPITTPIQSQKNRRKPPKSIPSKPRKGASSKPDDGGGGMGGKKVWGQSDGGSLYHPNAGFKSASELTWPPMNQDGTFKDEDGYEIMPITEMKVPRFWEPPLGMSPTDHTDKMGGKETIFLMIASYRDFQCHETINSAFLRADHPERLFIGAVDQVVPEDTDCLKTERPCDEDPEQMICKHRDQISIFRMNAGMATGPVTARHIGDRMYRGQHFVMQMDAHCWFVRHWDTLITQQWRSTGNEMAVLSSYLTDIQGSIDANGDSTRNTRPIMCNSDFEGMMPQRYLRHGSQPEDTSPIRDMPQLQPFWAAGFSFSRGHFKVRVPYDAYQPMVFQGEEISIGIRGFTYGYDFYAPKDSVVFHEYAERSTRRKKVKLFWENSGKHRGEGQKSLKRSMAIIGMAPDLDPASWSHKESGRYGISNVRPVEQFYTLFLIDTQNRKATQLCPFVKNGKMHRDFQPHLRADGRGIDYSKLTGYDTRNALEAVFEVQRPAGRSWLTRAIERNSRGGLTDAINNARKIGLDRTDPDLFQRAQGALSNAN